MVELLLTLGVLAIISTMSVVAVSQVQRNTQRQKLASDVQNVNTAITIYLANGGSLNSISDPNDVLLKLKSTRSKQARERHSGAPSGRLLDPRVVTSNVPTDSWKNRAVYDSTQNKFVVKSTGLGIEFDLDESLSEQIIPIETRNDGPLTYAESSTWVWDHASTNNPLAPPGATSFGTTSIVTDSNPSTPPIVTPPTNPPSTPAGPGPTTPVSPPEPTPPRLPTPIFDFGSGDYPESDFPLNVSITNTPSPSIGRAEYKINDGSWTPYTVPINVGMNVTLRAKFLSEDTTVYRHSSENFALYRPIPEGLSGSIVAEFHDPSGGPNLMYEITNGGLRFSHGDPIFILDGNPIQSGDPNVLSFTPIDFSEIEPGQKFKIGSFFYHNGSTYYDSHATAVSLKIAINMPERNQTIAFDLQLSLVNTPNDPDDAIASADYVKLINLSQNLPLTINGVAYKIILEFGATDSFGFSNQSQFHVYEGATGEGELLATIRPQ